MSGSSVVNFNSFCSFLLQIAELFTLFKKTSWDGSKFILQ